MAKVKPKFNRKPTKETAKVHSEPSRKDRRKAQRLEKKNKRNELFLRRKQFTMNKHSKTGLHKGQSAQESSKNQVQEAKNHHFVKRPQDNPLNTDSAYEAPKDMVQRSKDRRADRKQFQKFEKQMKEQRKAQLMEANEEEDKNIKLLEKQLRLNKRKSKTLPNSFVAAGLDYILEVCDSEKIQAAVNAERNLGTDSESEFEDDFATVTGKKPKTAKTTPKPLKSTSKVKDGVEKKKVQFDLEEDDDDLVESDESAPEEASSSKKPRLTTTMANDSSDSEDLDVDSDEYSESDFEDSEVTQEPPTPQETSKTKDTSESDSKTENGGDELWEDIYGRTRDKHGNIVQAPSKYIPPHLRAQESTTQDNARLKRHLKGLINRLAENNIHSISNQIDEMYHKNSRRNMNETLLSLFSEALISNVLTPERLVLEHAMLIAVLHANVGSEIGAFFLQNFVQMFDEMYSSCPDVSDKKIDNVIFVLSHMYTFKIFDCTLIFDILDKLSESLSEKNIELMLIILRTVGFFLRKDDPVRLKSFILRVQTVALETNANKSSRVQFMLDILISIKNNNMTKIPQYDPTHSEHLKKVIKTVIRKGSYVSELKITLEDLLKADERGRWWIVGSAWSGPGPKQDPSETKPNSGEAQFTQQVLELAREQRMNTTNRKNIFCILMTAEDYLDAFEKLLKLGLKGQPEQEIVHVLIHCLLQEKTYNQYYALVANQLCRSDRRHQMTVQCAAWDKFKEIQSLSKFQITNLAKFLAFLFIEKSLPLSILKVLEFTEMDRRCVRLLRQILLSILLHPSQDECLAVFTRVASSSKLRIFRESLRLFLHHFIIKNMKADLMSSETQFLKTRIDLVDRTLQHAKSDF